MTVNKKIEDIVIPAFQLEGELKELMPYGSGHINDTYLLRFSIGVMGSIRVILQKMNSQIFKKPEELMASIQKVTSYLADQITDEGGDPERETLTLIPARDGRSFYMDGDGEYWRSYKFITGASSYDRVVKPEHFYESGLAFGIFQRHLAEFPVSELHETIAGFHDTAARYQAFKSAVEEDRAGRAKSVQAEIDFVDARRGDAFFFGELLADKKLPLRVTHNDTKLNNIMIDDKTGKGICVIDLDTVMPGLAAFDFGDSIRFGANTAAEDETDLSKVSCDMELFELYTRGFIEGCGGRLTPLELELLPMGAKVMTYECGMRFLTDYLQGDSYFKIHRENHNLDRCRCQFRLVQDMEEKFPAMEAVIKKYVDAKGG